jgi:ectoine hydroxylase-related dioxygenase (phytanoyl-CoA dioxygenase family)
MSTKINTTVDVDRDLFWAAGLFPFEASSVVTDRPWAKTVMLSGPYKRAFLKSLPDHYRSKMPALRSISQLSDVFVPQMIGSCPERNLYLYYDHGGEPLSRQINAADKSAILRAYAAIQLAAMRNPELSDSLQPIKAVSLLDQFLAMFTDPNSESEKSAAYFLGQADAKAYADIFFAVEQSLRAFLSQADQIPLSLSHGDLRAGNISKRSNGELIFFDWDDAAWAAPGLSLHGLFSGCFYPFMALTQRSQDNEPERVSEARVCLSAYIEALCVSDRFDSNSLRQGLPASIAAGVLHYLMSFSHYPVDSRTLRKNIARNMRRRLSDFLDLLSVIVTTDEDREALANVFRATDRSRRAKRLDRLRSRQINSRAASSTTLESVQTHDFVVSDETEVMPTLVLSDQSRQTGVLSQKDRDQGVALFEQHGVLMLQDVINSELIKAVREDFIQDYGYYFDESDKPDALRVGDRRYMITATCEKNLANPNIFAPKLVLPILETLLGSKLVLGSLTAVTSLPGSEDQRLHKDNAALFEEDPRLHLPSFSIALIIPMIELNAKTGATAVAKGSHRVSSKAAASMPLQTPVVNIGSCYLMDSRLSHKGLANRSQHVRPIISLVYQRPWYSDPLNFKKQKPLDMPQAVFQQLPKSYKPLVEWAVET